MSDNILNELKSANGESRRGPRGCLELLSSIYPEHAEDLYTCFWYDGSAVASSKVIRREMGIRVPEYTIRRHRRGICSCPPPLSDPPEGNDNHYYGYDTFSE